MSHWLDLRCKDLMDFTSTSILDLKSILQCCNGNPDDLKSLLEETCGVLAWGVLVNKVIIWTGYSRVLIEVSKENSGIAILEYFPDISSHLNGVYQTYVISTSILGGLRKELYLNMSLRVPFEKIYYGSHATDIKDNDRVI